MIISFDIGGVLSKPLVQQVINPLYTSGHKIIIVSAIGFGSIIPVGDHGRWAFSVGRCYENGLYLGDNCHSIYTTSDYGHNDRRTGEAKALLLKHHEADLHIDDNLLNIEIIQSYNIKCIEYNMSKSLEWLMEEILKGA